MNEVATAPQCIRLPHGSDLAVVVAVGYNADGLEGVSMDYRSQAWEVNETCPTSARKLELKFKVLVEEH